MRKVLGSLLVVLLLSAFGIAPAAAGGAGIEDMSPQGKAAIEELAKCLNTGKSLDVFYLLDNSTSLDGSKKDGTVGTDPDKLRAEIVMQDVERWKQIGEIKGDIPVRTSLAFFASSAELAKPWTEIGDSTAKDYRDTIKNKQTQNYTNWLAGLTLANSQLEQSTADCKALIWFTDGGLWVGEDRASSNITALGELCGLAGIAGGARLPSESSQSGLLARIKSIPGLNIFGILLSTDSSSATPGLSKNELQESYWRSFMQPLVENSGQSVELPPTSSRALLPTGNLSCLPVNQSDVAYSAGGFLRARSAAQVALQFILLNYKTIGGTDEELPRNTDFWLDPGIAHFAVLTMDPLARIVNNDKKTVTPGKLEKSGGLTVMSFEVPKLKESVQWHYSAKQDAKVVYFTDLELNLDNQSLLAGQSTDLTGQFTVSSNPYTSTPADLSVFTSKKFDATFDGNKVDAVFSDEHSGIFALRNVNPAEVGTARIDATLELSTAHHDLRPIEFEMPKDVLDSSILPSVSNIEFKDRLESGSDSATAPVIVSGPTAAGTSGKVCFSEPIVIGDPQPQAIGKPKDRSATWKFDWRSNAVAPDGCVAVAAGESKTVNFVASNAEFAKSIVSIRFDYTLASEGLEAPASQVVQLVTDLKLDYAKLLGVFLVLMLLGLGLPLLGLHIFNIKSAQFSVTSQTRVGEFESEVTPSGVTNVAKIGGAQISDTTIQEDFRPLGAGSKANRVSLGSAQLQAKVPLWPLNNVRYELATSAATIATAGSGVLAAGTKRVSLARQDLANFSFVEVQQSEAEKLAANDAVKAMLYVIAEPSSDPNGFIKRLHGGMNIPAVYENLKAGSLVSPKASASSTFANLGAKFSRRISKLKSVPLASDTGSMQFGLPVTASQANLPGAALPTLPSSTSTVNPSITSPYNPAALPTDSGLPKGTASLPTMPSAPAPSALPKLPTDN